MNIVHVIPISRGILKETLSYFTTRTITRGMIVTVPLRNKQVNALVVDYEDISAHKAALRGAQFNLKKITSIKNSSFFLPSFLDAVSAYAHANASSTGATTFALTPQKILERAGTLPSARQKKSAVQKSNILHEAHILQADDRQRFAAYKALARESFARKESVFFCVPEVSGIKRIVATLSKGIEEYTFVMSNDISVKELTLRWKEILTSKHPVLIIGTGMFLSLPRNDIKTIIVDREGHSGYKMEFRPFVDIRTFTELLAHHINAKLIFGDVLLRPETIWKHKSGTYIPFAPLQFRALSNTKGKVIDLAAADKATKSHTIISEELSRLISQTKEHNGQIFLFAARRGLFTTTVCNDCGTLVSCPTCQTPLIIHNKHTTISNNNAIKRIFLCHKCGYERPVTDRCMSCLGWKMAPLGTGTDRIYDAVKTLAEPRFIFQIDTDKATPARANTIMERFLNTPGGILIGTEMALAYLPERITNVAVVAADSLFAIPDFRINERVFRLLLNLRARSENAFLIQTRQTEHTLWNEALRGDLLSFYRSEIHQRRELGYPPFSLFIKISYSGKPDKIESEKKDLESYLSAFSPISFHAFSSGARGNTTLHTVIKVSPHTWPNEQLLALLKELPYHFMVNVNPKHLL